MLTYNADRTSYYEGAFVDGMRHGEGTIVYASGNTYVGSWERDKKCGRGSMTWKTTGVISWGWRGEVHCCSCRVVMLAPQHMASV